MKFANPARSAVRLPRARHQAFSLSELLVAIAVIGVVTALTIPFFSDVAAVTNPSVSRRNAQNLATVAAAARVAGWNPTASKAQKLLILVTQPGAEGKGNFAGHYFSALMTLSDAAAASVFLTDELEYDQAGGGVHTPL